VVQRQEQLIGAPTWYMWRRPENLNATASPKNSES
jgi:hypothetical protein